MTDLEMMNTPSKWGQWPLLPVVRDRKLTPNTGIMIHGVDSVILRVYPVNMWDLGAGIIEELLKDVPFVEYDSLEGIIADGWKVD